MYLSFIASIYIGYLFYYIFSLRKRKELIEMILQVHLKIGAKVLDSPNDFEAMTVELTEAIAGVKSEFIIILLTIITFDIFILLL